MSGGGSLLPEIVLLGLLQGLLEWLPISSKGNLVLVMLYFLGMDPEKALSLSIFMHIGTLLSAAIYFRRDIMDVLSSLKEGATHPHGRRLLVFLISATILTGLVGLPLFLITKAVATLENGLIAVTGFALILTGLLERKGEKSSGKRKASDLKLADGLTVGLAQGLSAVPGVSRSGVTTTVLLLKGFEASDALRLSFILSIPAVLAAEAGIVVLQGLPAFDLQPLSLGILAAFCSSLLAIHSLIRLAGKIRFWLLCLLLGVLSLTPLLSYM